MLNLSIVPSPCTHTNTYMGSEENRYIGTSVYLGGRTFRIEHVYIVPTRMVSISCYESWGSGHAPMTTCGKMFELRYDFAKHTWTFYDDEYMDKYLTEEGCNALDEIVSAGALVCGYSAFTSCRFYTELPRRLAKVVDED